MSDRATPDDTIRAPSGATLSGAATSGEGDGGPVLRAVADWVMQAALADSSIGDLLTGTCNRLRGAGVPLSRVNVSYRTLHPAFDSVALTWRRDEGLASRAFSHGSAMTAEVWRRSPFFFMLRNGVPMLRRRLTGRDALVDFPILEELREAGCTDYLALVTGFGETPADALDGSGIATSWASDRAGGFTDDDIAALVRIKQRLAVACKLAIREQISDNVVRTYLGADAGRQVLDGRIKRGDGGGIDAVLWYSDLRRSSVLAEEMPPNRFIALLNGYFDCTAGSVIDAGGEVVSYIGDAVLAIFPMREPDARATTATAALDAVTEARRRLADVNRTLAASGAETIATGIALHAGELIFGNVGARHRLAYTVIGQAVNEVVRIEGQTKALGCDALASGRFLDLLPPERAAELVPQGPQSLRNIGHAVDVFAVPRPAPAAEPPLD